MGQAGLGLFDGIGFDPEGQVLGLGQAVVSLGQLGAQHLGVLGADGIVAVVLRRDPDALLKALRVCRQVDEGQFEMDRAVEEIQKAAPLLEDRRLVLLLGQLVIDVLELDRAGVIVVPDAADPVRKHPVKGDRLLGRAGHAVIFSCLIDDPLHLLSFAFCQVCRKLYVSLFRLFQNGKQSFLPPFVRWPAGAGSRNSCLSDRAGSSAG